MRMRSRMNLIGIAFVCLVSGALSLGFETETVLSYLENNVVVPQSSSLPHSELLMVPLTLIEGAASKGAGISLSLSL